MSELKPINETLGLEDVLLQYGSFIWNVQGYSMQPFIKGKSDLVEVRLANEPIKPYEVALYRKSDEEKTRDPKEKHGSGYILHRVIKKDGKTYTMLGDNCIALERIPEDRVIGVMTGLIRDGKRVELTGLRHSAYMHLWVRPWRFRIYAIRVRMKLSRTWWKFVEKASPYTPRPVKDCIKKLIMR